ncbi:hypothetical protein MPH_02032 [Macrophomina phaseolina MS6]|uniref:Uncharacterized protein n=1 Tax=Macrophomina phaseolina (strain MS6) TaxID=1126212 RepID=K2S6Z4_MACPH|nr:hypothetical protein MPH_02032 [Macrophomina phaseolina MS6]
MGISYSKARYLAPAAFLYDFAAQQYGLLSSPNMKDIHNANLSFFSPQPYFIALFFFPQQIAQLVWLWKLWTKAAAERDLQDMVGYVPIYALGNICIGTWMFFWNASDLRTSNVFVIINTVAQLAYVSTRLPALRTSSTASVLTHAVAKTFAGIGVLDLLHNTSAAYHPGELNPGIAVKVLTGVGFGIAGALSDWIFGGCLVYDLVALAVGQNAYGGSGNGWARLLGAPRYEAGLGEYVRVQEEVDESV